MTIMCSLEEGKAVFQVSLCQAVFLFPVKLAVKCSNTTGFRLLPFKRDKALPTSSILPMLANHSCYAQKCISRHLLAPHPVSALLNNIQKPN